MIPVFFIATFLIFVVVRILPGDPIQAQFGERRIPDNLRQAYVERYHFDEPLYVQYALYMGDILCLNLDNTPDAPCPDLGESIARQRPINEIFVEALPRTLRLAGLSGLIEAIIAIPIGIWSARRAGGTFDNSVLVVSIILLSIPVFVLATLSQYIFGVELGWFPVAGISEGWYSYLMPAIIVASGLTAVNIRLMRSTTLETYREDFIRTARAKGADERRILSVHVLRNAVIPVVTVLGLDLGALIGGTLVTESVFNIPGVGFTIVRAITQRDNTIVIGVSIFLVLAYLFINLLVDLMYAWLDPRIRYD